MTTMTTSILPLRAGTYGLDRESSSVQFRVRHAGLSDVRGQFRRFDVSLVVGDTLRDVAVRAAVDLASIDTNQLDRDAQLRDGPWFSADTHPAMTFNSTRISPVGGVRYRMDGLLTIHGVTKRQSLRVDFDGMRVHPADDSLTVGFVAAGEIRRSEYGLDAKAAQTKGLRRVSDLIHVVIDAQFLRAE